VRDDQQSRHNWLARRVRGISEKIFSFASNAPINADEKNRLRHYTVFLILGVPTMVLFGIYNLVHANYALCLLIAISASGLTLGWYLLGRLKRGIIIYRINLMLFGLLLLYMAWMGGEGGSKILWMYTYPLIAYFLLGKKEGNFWVAGIAAVLIGMLWIVPRQLAVYPYNSQFAARFMTTFAIVTAIGFWFEYLRHQYRIGMENEQQKLEQEKMHLTQEINERIKVEGEKEALIAQLKDVNEELKNFAYILSHDLRAPLVNIKGFSTELQNSLNEIDVFVDARMPQEHAKLETIKKDIRESLDFICTSTSRMDAQVTAILTLSLHGRRELRFEAVDTNRLVRYILKSLAHQIEERQTQVTIGNLPVVLADAIAMEQIFGNLLDNALKYLDPGRPGSLIIAAGTGPGETVFSVQDNGRGIVKEDSQKIFEIFRRSGKQDVRGYGMGLSYVKTLVKRHGGSIWCESELGAGSTFFFTIATGHAKNLKFDDA